MFFPENHPRGQLARLARQSLPGTPGNFIANDFLRNFETPERLHHFLRAMFDQPERVLIPLEEELVVVHAYLEIESLRLGHRLKIEEDIDAGLAEILTPPFSFQPMVENAVQHGVQSSPGAGCLRLDVRRIGKWLEMSVSDDGRGVPSSEVEQVFFAAGPRAHALHL